MAEDPNIALARKFLTRFKAGDYEALHALQSKVDWDIFPGRAAGFVPWMGHFEGPDGAAACMEAFSSTVTTESFEIEKFLSGPGEVAALIRAVWITIEGNRRFSLDYFALFGVESGKIISIREFGDTTEAIEAYRGQTIDA